MLENYQEEVQAKWGSTQAYQESEDKTAHYTKEQWAQIHQEMDAIMVKFARYNQDGLAPESLPVQELVAKWQQFMTKYYYDCTLEILSALGRMYAADERFRNNINRYGVGTADFLSAAIKCYCK